MSKFKELPLYTSSVIIWKVVPPILILLGTIGNILSILVLTRRSIRESTTSLFLTVLACSDLLVLYSGLLRQWVLYLFETDVRHVSEVGCKLNIWLVYSSLDFSAWILIAVTLERVISAWLPHRARTVCTKTSAKIFLVGIGIFILTLNSHLLYGVVFKVETNADGKVFFKKCTEINTDYYLFFNKVWPWIDLCAFCVVPFTVIVIGNALILIRVLQSQKKTQSTDAPALSPRKRGQKGRYGKQSSMTAMLFTLNIVFLLSTTPVSVYNIGYAYWMSEAADDKVAELDLWWAVVNMLMYTNNTFNFLLYCLSGTKFRVEFFRMLAKLKPPVANNVHETPLRNYTASPRESRADRQSNDDQSRSNITESIKPKRHETDGQQLMSINTEVSNLPHYSTLSLRQENENCAPRNCQKDDTKSIDTQDFSEV